ncbi:3103_t:CDS:2 [Funneliformis mosseae]|uniref:3103_t:CDS:1 n=1 Tax=Funneliformis mosseae TaxID=27381 RepID=A0A9N8YNJ5_FUNMO|nr:3103_t:CDS:2 [Funneliformis mosseae]
MIWSTARPMTVYYLVDKVFDQHKTKLLDIWTRDKLDLSKVEYFDKSRNIVKNLNKIWQSEETWNQMNTILIDDSLLKARLQPFNAIHPISFRKKFQHENDDELLK